MVGSFHGKAAFCMSHVLSNLEDTEALNLVLSLLVTQMTVTISNLWSSGDQVVVNSIHLTYCGFNCGIRRFIHRCYNNNHPHLPPPAPSANTPEFELLMVIQGQSISPRIQWTSVNLIVQESLLPQQGNILH